MTTSPHLTFTRKEWRHFRDDVPLTLKESELATLRGFNDPISLDEVADIYLPLARLINLYVEETQKLHQSSGRFLGKTAPKVPYIIGVAGSVAVGKSTTSRILQALLSRWPNSTQVEWVTTDGFLYPNSVLEKKGLMNKKGFPESFDRNRFLDFLLRVKSGEKHVKIPIYSHEKYDIVRNKYKTINQPDILIVEGLNILQSSLPSKKSQPKIFISDLIDFSIYVDADSKLIQKWYLDRFITFREWAKNKPKLYFYRFTKWSDKKAIAFAKSIWKKINQKNLDENILPFKYRARLILQKTTNHKIEKVLLRRL
jgi:type I pantothenate kinase